MHDMWVIFVNKDLKNCLNVNLGIILLFHNNSRPAVMPTGMHYPPRTNEDQHNDWSSIHSVCRAAINGHIIYVEPTWTITFRSSRPQYRAWDGLQWPDGAQPLQTALQPGPRRPRKIKWPSQKKVHPKCCSCNLCSQKYLPRKTATRTQLGRGIRKLVTLFDDISTVIHQHDLHCQVSEGAIDEEDEEFANLEKDEMDAKKRESVIFVNKFSLLNSLIRTLVGKEATQLSNSFYISSLSCKII